MALSRSAYSHKRTFTLPLVHVSTGRRLQIRDNRGRIVAEIKSDGDITDTRRRKLGGIEDLGLDERNSP